MFSMVSTILESDGFAGVPACVEILLNEAMKIERSHALGAQPHERKEGRLGYANGYKPKAVRSRIEVLKLAVPRVRNDADFYPSAQESGVRSVGGTAMRHWRG